MTPLPFPDRIVRLLEEQSSGCWVWRGGCDRNGYSHVYWNGRTRLGHRLFYEMLVGPIPDGLTLDHLCRVRGCVNPLHLEPISQRENTLRGIGFPAINVAKTHCPEGHPLVEGNLSQSPSLIRKGARYCLTCARASGLARNRRRRALLPRNPRVFPTHCPKGHPLSGDNLLTAKLRLGRRDCRACHIESRRAYRARIKVEMLKTPEGIEGTERLEAQLAERRAERKSA